MKGEKTILTQEILREKVKIAKALNNDIYYYQFAEYIEIAEHSFYNWLKGYYDLSTTKARKLENIINDLID